MVCALVISIFTNSYGEIYLWPLHGERLLSSSFSEYRDGHYHAGIDLRTSGRIGLPCLAVGDGAVYRLKVAPGGYGKALYLKLDDGRVAVYAHLHAFEYRLDSLVYYHRLERKASWCDLSLPDERFRFSVGDTICFTGTTGTTAPHLHFEMRDGEGRPFNPIMELYSVPDDRPPIISGLEVIPLSPGSVVNGSPYAERFLLRASRGNAYVLDDTLQLDGRFAFGLSVWDEQGFGRYALAPLSVEFFVDADTLYSLRNTLFSYTQTDEIILEYDLHGEGAAGRYLLLYRRPGTSRSDRSGPGVIHSEKGGTAGRYLEKGMHEARITVRDAAGNAAQAHFTFVFHDYPVIETARKLVAADEVVVRGVDPDGGSVTELLFESPDGGGRWEPVTLEPMGAFRTGTTTRREGGLYRFIVRDDEGAAREHWFAAPKPVDLGGNVFCECIPSVVSDGLAIRIVTDRALAENPRITLGEHVLNDACVVHRLDAWTFMIHCGTDVVVDGVNILSVSGIDYRGYPLRAYSAFRAVRLYTGARSRFPATDSLDMNIEASSVRGEALCLIREIPVPVNGSGGLNPVSPPLAIEFPVDRLPRPLRVVCEPAPNVGLFRLEKETEWECIGVPSREGGSVILAKPGTYAFMADGLPPYLEHVAFDTIPRGSGFFRTTRYYVPVREDESGVDPYSAVAMINDREVVCEWDALRERLLIPVPAAFPAGMVRLHVELSDRAGNRSAGDFGFMIE
ncbi:MAG TPA: M23 family metallopeptidase [Patescibacteria group bacterium]|nr:M23 family metallopeptidase [Patescibacteria group bacterium]